MFRLALYVPVLSFVLHVFRVACVSCCMGFVFRSMSLSSSCALCHRVVFRVACVSSSAPCLCPRLLLVSFPSILMSFLLWGVLISFLFSHFHWPLYPTIREPRAFVSKGFCLFLSVSFACFGTSASHGFQALVSIGRGLLFPVYIFCVLSFLFASVVMFVD